ncbi:GlxA family transcriptional regulator [Amylibacter sp. IMCC11727]|uniref:GlxA family transcriptional regulator n=1 Tax=Amylibacter sp. IMCC11727 TaxID=3039851 RepID=UPI00244E2C5F|nr:GlxA family transcriptional regulator [Amylibacter sp. IMCC11727]WGI20977.1 GlxA family transcriptional regulator [Amylibacter sp. IMCC11727]
MKTTPASTRNKADQQTPIRIGFLLIDGFSSLCITSMTGPFRSANRELGYDAFSWDFLSTDDEPITASDGISILTTLSSKSAQHFDYFFTCAGMQSDPPNRSALNATLHRFSRHSDVFGALCIGSFMLARAGFLDGYDFTLHWENQPAFSEEFPELEVSPNLYVMDRDRWTGSGGLSSMDIALHIIAERHGAGIANAVGNQYQIDRIRSASVGQRPYSLNQYETLPKPVQTAIHTMIANMETPLSIPEIAQSANKTVRSLERLFAKHLASSPARYYRTLRLEKVRQLLWHTNLSILEIALMTGFPSPSHLSRLYQTEFGIKPSEDRKDRAAL